MRESTIISGRKILKDQKNFLRERKKKRKGRRKEYPKEEIPVKT
jgi:hypothetical protein